jgi:hypothetical protein
MASNFPVWPPNLDALKADMQVDPTDTRFDVQMQMDLDSAIAYVERVRTDVNFDGSVDPDAPPTPVTDDLVLGTLRYARRLNYRRTSPGGYVVVDGVGSTAVPGWDADIEKLLRIGRYARLRFA